MSWSTQPNTQIFTYFRAEKQLKEFTGERNAEKKCKTAPQANFNYLRNCTLRCHNFNCVGMCFKYKVYLISLSKIIQMSERSCPWKHAENTTLMWCLWNNSSKLWLQSVQEASF